MALRDVFALPLVLLAAVAPASSNADAAWGRMICEVVGSRIVSAEGAQAEFVSHLKDDFPTGTEFHFEYGLDDASGLTFYLSETAKRNVLINETFLANDFRGISKVDNMAVFGATYSEASFGQYWLNYKGNDQLFIKNGCDGRKWSGHFVQTHVSGIFTQVVTLECRNFVDAREEVFALLATMEKPVVERLK